MVMMNTMTETQPIERIEKAPVLITGMSGAGINSAARVLEDLGWYVSAARVDFCVGGVVSV